MQQELKNPFSGGDESYEMEAAQHTSFFDEIDSVKHELVQYEDNIERIEGLQRRSLAESRPTDLELLQQKIDQLRNESQSLAQHLRNRIKTLESQSFRDASRAAQADNVKRQFMNLIRKYQSTEMAFQKRNREVTARQFRIVDPEASESQIQQYIDEDPTGQVFSQALMQSNRRGEARSALTEVQARHREIQKIEATISELAQLFHDMEIMVAEQDEQITAVEQNVYEAQTDIERGVDNQYGAIRKAKSWRKMKWCCVVFVIVVIVALALVLGIYFGTHHS